MLGSISFAALSMAFSRHDALKDPSLRKGLVSMVRKRVPEVDVEDVVQATFADALSGENAPQDDEGFRRWVYGIAAHKVADRHRRTSREVLDVPENN